MTREEFEKIVLEELERLPKRFRDRMENVVVVVEPGMSEGGDLGLYEGVPLTERNCDYGNVLPDRITLFQQEIEEDAAADGIDVRVEIRDTLRHEIAHYFGISDERLDDLGVY